jgi:hypothetical protein
LIGEFGDRTTRDAATTTALSIRSGHDTHDFVTRTEEGPQADGCDIRRTGKD